MAIFTYDDIVTFKDGTFPGRKLGDRAWIVGVYEEREGNFLLRFPHGVVYTVEFEDGSSLEVHEENLTMSN